MLENFAIHRGEAAEQTVALAPIVDPRAAPAATRSALNGSVQVAWCDGETWDEIAAGFDDVRQEQTDCFNAGRWGEQRLERLVVSRHGRIIGGAVLFLVIAPGTNRGIAIAKWGPLWRRRGETPDIENLRLLVKVLCEEYVERRGLFLSVLPQVDPDHSEDIVAELEALGFSTGSQLRYPKRYFVNTSLKTDELKASLDQKWRYNLKKSHKEDFKIEWTEGEAGLDQFMHLYEQMLERKKFHDTSAIATLPGLVRASIKAHRPAIAMLSHDGKPTAGAVVDISGDCAVYLYGATDDRALRSKAGYAMHWWIAQWLCNDPQMKWYDLGGCDGDDGLHQFKKGFVGKLGSIIKTPASHDYSSNLFASALGRSIFAARDVKGFLSRIIHSPKSGLGK